MSGEPSKAASDVSDDGIGSLGGCFVEGNPEQRSRERGLRRRSLAISMVLQAAVLAAVISIPFFGKTERVTYANAVPIPPYYHRGATRPSNPTTTPSAPGRRLTPCFFCPAAPTVTHRADTGGDSPVQEQAFGPGDPTPCPGCISIDTPASQPQPPVPAVEQSRPRTLHVARLDPALLTHRVEPVYPTLSRQMRREGRVELNALIATDGTIQSLHVVSGDPMFYDSALTAVRQWVYKPTSLNGQPVQIETNITVIYTLAH
ncbi:MAG TPA: energy transducer TonB [Candidatus Saccharimonadales bacterium]|nr:energy transducer TonB [Candidatus Saccharimonadales bacterium]